MVYEYVPAAFNYAAVFGAVLGMYIVLNLDVAVREALTFIKGWRSDK